MTERVARTRASQLPGVLFRSLLTLRSAPPHIRRERFVVVVLGIASELALRVLPLPRVAKLFGVGLSPAVGGGPAPEEAAPPIPLWAFRRLQVVSTVMKRWPVDGTCLRQSLVAGQRLRSLDPQLRVGVARGEAGLEAHAWLEVGGRSLDPTSDRYDELRLPAS